MRKQIETRLHGHVACLCVSARYARVATAPTNTVSRCFRAIIQSFRNAAKSYWSALRADWDGWMQLKPNIWVPSRTDDFEIKLLHIVQDKQTGYRSAEVTAISLRDRFRRKELSQHETDLVSNGLLCNVSRIGAQVPRLQATTLHAHMVWELLYFVYLVPREGTDNRKYVLILKDKFRDYKWLSITARFTASHRPKLLERGQ